MDKLKAVMNSELAAWYFYHGGRHYLECAIKRIEWPNLIVISGHLLKCKNLVEFQNGAMLEISHRECGRRDVYYPDEVIITLSQCRVERKWIEHVIPRAFEDQQELKINLLLRADIQVFFDKEKE